MAPSAVVCRLVCAMAEVCLKVGGLCPDGNRGRGHGLSDEPGLAADFEEVVIDLSGARRDVLVAVVSEICHAL